MSPGIDCDAVVVLVEEPWNEGHAVCQEVGTAYYIWQEVTAQESIEAEVICRNMKHLEQTAREGGATQTEFMQKVQKDHGLNEMSAWALYGTLELKHGVSVEQAAWLWVIKMTDMKQGERPTLAGLTRDQFQGIFKVARERKLSAVVGLHYTMWKALVENDGLTEVL